jgi:hypothetical protein
VAASLEEGEPQHIEANNPTLVLLVEAHTQLIERKQAIEKNLPRVDDLRRELEAINAQVESLEATLAFFAGPDIQSANPS